jgi:hypothetical protein
MTNDIRVATNQSNPIWGHWIGLLSHRRSLDWIRWQSEAGGLDWLVGLLRTGLGGVFSVYRSEVSTLNPSKSLLSSLYT